jgi:predicted Zn-ribbon and HTH transcriptional regulator
MESYYKSEDEKKFCQREISKLFLATNLVESVIRVNSEYPHSEILEFSYDEMYNASKYECDNCGFETLNHHFMENECPECIEGTIEDTPLDVLEWWIIDEFQHRKLGELGETTLMACGLKFWGRTTSGQSIELDGIFQKIYQSVK